MKIIKEMTWTDDREYDNNNNNNNKEFWISVWGKNQEEGVSRNHEFYFIFILFYF